MVNDVLTVEEVAGKLRTPAKTVRHWLKIGKLQGVKLGKAWLIRESTLEKALEGEAEKK